MWIFRAWEFLKWLVAVLLSTVTFFCVAFLNATAFPFEGEKQYYLYNESSQAQIKREISLLELPFVRGESITISCLDEEILERLLERYSASVVKVENFSDGVSYYCYSPKLKKGIVLDGVVVNLQIAVKGERVALGTPIIFGGY